MCTNNPISQNLRRLRRSNGSGGTDMCKSWSCFCFCLTVDTYLLILNVLHDLIITWPMKHTVIFLSGKDKRKVVIENHL